MFSRDLVVMDIESTGLDVRKNEVLQIAAIRLDKNTLQEVARFSTYVRPTNWENQDPKAMAVNGIPHELVKTAPTVTEVLEQFEAAFPANEVLLAAYNAWFDMTFFKQMYMKTERVNPYDFHCFDIWGLAYMFWSKEARTPNPKQPIGFNLADMAALLEVPTPEGGKFHDALVDTEVTVEILRRLVTKL